MKTGFSEIALSDRSSYSRSAVIYCIHSIAIRASFLTYIETNKSVSTPDLK